MAYELADVEDRNRQSPDTFRIPEADDRDNVPIGAYVKLIFNEAERMWVKLHRRICIDEKIVYVGELANDPVIVTELTAGDEVTFEPKHICDIREPE